MRLLEVEALPARLRPVGLLLPLRGCHMSSFGKGCYQPALPRELVHRLYLLGQSSHKPMTKLLREALESYLDIREQQPAH